MPIRLRLLKILAFFLGRVAAVLTRKAAVSLRPIFGAKLRPYIGRFAAAAAALRKAKRVSSKILLFFLPSIFRPPDFFTYIEALVNTEKILGIKKIFSFFLALYEKYTIFAQPFDVSARSANG